MKEFKVSIPEGLVIDEENSTFECIKFKKIVSVLPKTWEDVEIPIDSIFFYIDSDSDIETFEIFDFGEYQSETNRNLVSSKDTAKAIRALTQLLLLRDIYNDGWKADFGNEEIKFTIYIFRDDVFCEDSTFKNNILSFRTDELRYEFMENFKDLILTAKELL